MASRLEFRTHSVKRVDETNGSFAERFGNDEIFLGGHNVLQNGETAPIPTSARSTARAAEHQGTYEIVYDWKLRGRASEAGASLHCGRNTTGVQRRLRVSIRAQASLPAA